MSFTGVLATLAQVSAALPSQHPSDVVSRLERLVRKQRLPHALLLVGAAHSELLSAALETSRLLLCPTLDHAQSNDAGSASSLQDNQSCKSCRLLEKTAADSTGTSHHPDLVLFDGAAPESDATERLREILTAAHRRPFLGGSRSTVISNSHELAIAAHNLLLKTLEEPRPKNYYILTTPNVSLLPITIRSRCQVWFFPDRLTSMPLLEQGLHQLVGERLALIARGELHTGIALAFQIAKEMKDTLPQLIGSCLHHARAALITASSPHEARRWSNFIGDLTSLEYALLTRNFNASYHFAGTFERLSEKP